MESIALCVPFFVGNLSRQANSVPAQVLCSVPLLDEMDALMFPLAGCWWTDLHYSNRRGPRLLPMPDQLRGNSASTWLEPTSVNG